MPHRISDSHPGWKPHHRSLIEARQEDPALPELKTVPEAKPDDAASTNDSDFHSIKPRFSPANWIP